MDDYLDNKVMKDSTKIEYDVDYDQLLNKYGPEGLVEIAAKLIEIARKHVEDALNDELKENELPECTHGYEYFMEINGKMKKVANSKSLSNMEIPEEDYSRGFMHHVKTGQFNGYVKHIE